MTEINGNLELEKDTEYGDNLLVHGNITGKDGKRYNLIVRGDINARDINAVDIDAWDINAWNIDAVDIDAWDINAVDIDAWDINASFILCATLKQKEGSKLLARHIIRNRSSYEQKDLSKSD
jgi:hypothetical protein